MYCLLENALCIVINKRRKCVFYFYFFVIFELRKEEERERKKKMIEETFQIPSYGITSNTQVTFRSNFYRLALICSGLFKRF